MSRVAALLAALLLLGACRPRPLVLEDLNVLLIAIDTLGAEHVGYLRPEGAHTPNIDRLAAQGAAFRRAYSPAPWTQPAIASLFSSQMPSRHGVLRLFQTFSPGKPVLAELLEARGFETAGVVSHDLLRARLGFARGTGHWDETPVGGHDAITSERVTNAAIRWLDGRAYSAPFFLFVHYFDPHYAYQHHPEHDLTSGYSGKLRPGMDIWELLDARATLDAEDLRYLVGLYREEIAYTDAEVGRLLSHLADRGLRERTLVILTADHGEEFMRHGWIGHTRSLYDELLHVPLVFNLPGRIPPRLIDDPVSLLDVLPTLLALSGRPESRDEWEGISLLPAIFDGTALPAARELRAEVSFAAAPHDPSFVAQKTAFKTALLGPDWKLIHDLLEDRYELYDRSRDPDEQKDLWSGAAEQQELRRRLLEWESTRGTGAGTARGIDPTPDELARLRALGYLP